MNEKRDTKGHLSTGSVRKYRRKTPKLIAELPENAPTINQTEDPNKKIGVFFRFGFIIIGVTVISIVASFVIVGITVLPIVKIDGSHWLVERSSYTQGEAPAGSVVLNLGEPLMRDTASRFKLIYSGAPKGSVIQILATPLSLVSTTVSNEVTINNHLSGYYSNKKISKKTLGDVYLAICLKGNCGKTNSIIEVPSDYILGKILGQTHLALKLGLVPKAEMGKHV